MSSQPKHALTRESLRRLLAGVGGAKTEPTPEPAWRAHDWRQCRCFNDEQLRRLEGFAAQVATAIGGVFTRFCRRPFEVTVVSTSQQYASQVTEQLAVSAAQDCFLPFGQAEDRPYAVLLIPAKTAHHWAQLLLGTMESADAAQGLSSLEHALVADIARAVTEALSLENSGLTARPSGDLITGTVPVNWDPMEELFKMSFGVRRTDASDQSEAVFVLPCAALAGPAGKTVGATAQTPGSDASGRVLQCLQELPVPVSACLGSVILSVEEVLGLAVDDVVVLDQSPQEPIDVTIQGRRAFRGFPVHHQGRMAVLITEAVALSG